MWSISLVIAIVFDALWMPVAFRAEAKKLVRHHDMRKSAKKSLQKSAKKPKFLFSPTFFWGKPFFFPCHEHRDVILQFCFPVTVSLWNHTLGVSCSSSSRVNICWYWADHISQPCYGLSWNRGMSMRYGSQRDCLAGRRHWGHETPVFSFCHFWDIYFFYQNELFPVKRKPSRS